MKQYAMGLVCGLLAMLSIGTTHAQELQKGQELSYPVGVSKEELKKYVYKQGILTLMPRELFFENAHERVFANDGVQGCPFVVFYTCPLEGRRWITSIRNDQCAPGKNKLGTIETLNTALLCRATYVVKTLCRFDTHKSLMGLPDGRGVTALRQASYSNLALIPFLLEHGAHDATITDHEMVFWAVECLSAQKPEAPHIVRYLLSRSAFTGDDLNHFTSIVTGQKERRAARMHESPTDAKEYAMAVEILGMLDDARAKMAYGFGVKQRGALSMIGHMS